jgi:hypothetical protein
MQLWVRSRRSIRKMASLLYTIVKNIKDIAYFEKCSRNQ